MEPQKLALNLPKIYPITDTRISGLSHLEQVKLLVEGGARIIQLREKYASSQDFYYDAKAAVDLARSIGVAILINDRVDIAIAVKADGVHLGQDDLPPEEARKLLGDRAIIGYSTHSLDQVREAISMPIDYLAFGPVFHTSTKDDPDEVVGVEELNNIRNSIGSMPLVAIGGIDAERVVSVWNAGADSAAMIGAILSDPTKITDTYRDLSSRQADIVHNNV